MEKSRICVVCGKPLEVTRYFDKNGTFKGYGQSYKKVTCSRSCTNVYRAGIDLERRFWDRVDKSGGPDQCWPFNGTTDKGYGRMKWGDRNHLAHRIAWSLANNSSLPSEDVLHECDNPLCCNPSHLFLGSHDDNMADMACKGRSNTVGTKFDRRAVLTPGQVREIRRRFSNGERNKSALAREYGVSHTAIYKIIKLVNWPNIN